MTKKKLFQDKKYIYVLILLHIILIFNFLDIFLTGFLSRNSERPQSNLFGEVRATFPKLNQYLVFHRICTSQVFQGDSHRKDEYEFLNLARRIFAFFGKKIIQLFAGFSKPPLGLLLL